MVSEQLTEQFYEAAGRKTVLQDDRGDVADVLNRERGAGGNLLVESFNIDGARQAIVCRSR